MNYLNNVIIVLTLMSSNSSEKTVDLVNDSNAKVLKENQDFISIDVSNLNEGKYYRVEYEGDVYAIEKQNDGQLSLYEVVE